MERDKVTDVLEDVGAVVLANACGPCIGQVGAFHQFGKGHQSSSCIQWKREDKKGEENGTKLLSFVLMFDSLS